MEKPLASINRTRHNPNAKYAGLHGRTARRRMNDDHTKPTIARTPEVKAVRGLP